MANVSVSEVDIIEIGASKIRVQTGPLYPAISGVIAPSGSKYLCTVDGTWWQKAGTAATDWIKADSQIAPPNGELITLLPGMPVCIQGPAVLRAANTSEPRSFVLGLVAINTAPTLPTIVITNDSISLPAAAWDLVTGDVGGLVPGAIYYLGSLGMLTTVAPQTTGMYVAQVGQAITANIMVLMIIRKPILL